METVTTREVPVTGTEVVESTAHPRVSWGAVFAGTVVALGVWAMLYALGLAVGLAALDPSDPGTLKSSGIFTGIWGIIAPLVALFVGGVVAARCAGVTRRLDGAIHGLVMWGLSTVVGAWMIGTFMVSLLSGAAAMGRTALESGARQGREAVQAPMAKAREALDELRGGSAAPGRRGATRGQQQALAAAEESGKAFGGVFGALLLGMITAVVGGVVGVRTRRRGRKEVVTTTPVTPPPAPPLTTQREAYP